MTIHYLKTIPPYFQHVVDGNKNFEYRKNDRNFQVGDILHLAEWEAGFYTGRRITVRVIYILRDFVPSSYVIMGTEVTE